MSNVSNELQSSSQSALIELYELDMKPLVRGLAHKDGRTYDAIRFDGDSGEQIMSPGARPARVSYNAEEGQYAFYDPAGSERLAAMRKIRFCNQRNELGGDVVFAGKKYTAYPIDVNGFAVNGSGQLARPKMSLANVTGVLTALAGSYDDLIGAQLRRIRTFARFLDAENFSAGNATADPNAKLPDEVWVVDRKIREDRMMVQFELSSMLDLQGVRIPCRKIVARSCPANYRDPEDGCRYTAMPGDPGFVPYGVDDKPVPGWEAMSLEEQFTKDACGKLLTSCGLRFGRNNKLPFVGFPGATVSSR